MKHDQIPQKKLLIVKYISFFSGALTYAELSTLVPRSGSDYVYFMTTFNKYHRFWARLPSFLYSVVMIMVIRPASIAVVLLTFSHYVSDPILDAYCISDNDVIEKVKMTLAICGLGKYKSNNVTVRVI